MLGIPITLPTTRTYKTMGGLLNTERPSLERLKALDSLPTLSRQLTEAKQLCNHSGRADMILKWLLAKLKTSTEARCEPETWTLLSLTFRPQPASRIASLVASNDLLACGQEVLNLESPSKDLILAMGQSFNLLFEMASSPMGASLQAALSVGSVKAASFAGDFFRCIYHALRTGLIELLDVPRHGLLDPALGVWASRKQSQQDDSSFATHCLVPAAYLYTQLSTNELTMNGKRKREGTLGQRPTDYKRTLESLLAKNIFLPARFAFLQTTGSTYSSSTSQPQSDGTTSTLDDRLSVLKEAMIPENADDQAPGHQLVPSLLDIALRCTPALNSRQRLKERPWVETVFSALVDCLNVPGGDSRSRKALIEMLDVVKKRGSLSTQSLQSLAESCGTASDANGGFTDWNLVAKIVELDANVYAAEVPMKALFQQISGANKGLEQGKPVTASPTTETESNALRSKWNSDIIIPIMNACAKNRNLEGFVAVWYEQLIGENTEHTGLLRAPWSLWTELDEAFAALVEPNLNETKMLQLLKLYHSKLKRGSEASEEPPKPDEYAAAITVLDGLVGGLRSDDLRDHALDICSSLNEDLVKLLGKDASAIEDGSQDTFERCPNVWALLSRTFEIVYPAKAAEAEHEDLESLLSTPLFLQAIEKALSVSRDPSLPDSSSVVPDKSLIQAQCLVGIVCHLLHRSPSSEERCKEFVQKLARKDAKEALALYPKLLSLLNEDELRSLHQSWIQTAAENIERGGNVEDTTEHLQAIGQTTANDHSSKVIQCAVQVATDHFLFDGPDEQHSQSERLVALTLLSTLGPARLPLSSQQAVLQALTARPHLSAHEGEQLLQRRLSLLIGLLERGSPDLTVSPCLGWLWEVVNPAQSSEKLNEEFTRLHTNPTDPATLALLEQATALLVRRLSTSKLGGASNSTLREFAETLSGHVGMMDAHRPFAQNLGLLSIVKAAISLFNEKTAEGFIEAELVALYQSKLLGEAEQLFDSVASQSASDDGATLIAVLDALLAIPGNFSSRSWPHHMNEQSLFAKASTRSHAVASSPDASHSQLVQSPRSAAALSRCFRLRCQAGLHSGLMKDALSVLESPLSPPDLEAVHSQLTKILNSADTASKLSAVSEVVPSDSHHVSAAQLNVLRVGLAALSREDQQKPEAQHLRRILRQVMEVASRERGFSARSAALDCAVLILHEKPFLVNQHGIEATLSMAKACAQDPTSEGVIYLAVCRLITVILQQYRSRLNDRLHLVVDLLQTLLTRLFKPNKSGSSPKSQKPLTAKHGRTLSRLLQLLCSPPQQWRRSKTSDLIDEARKAQRRVGQHVQHVLHHYCAQLLVGTLAEGVREALMPGLWAVIEAIEVNAPEGVKSLSAAMNNSERAVLRSVYEEYKMFGKWKGC